MLYYVLTELTQNTACEKQMMANETLSLGHTKAGPNTDHPGTPRTKRCLDPGWTGVKVLRRSLDWWRTVEKHRLHGLNTAALRINTEPTRMTQDHHGSATDRPRPTPDHAGPNTDAPGPPRTIPDALRTLPDRSKPNTDRPGPSRIRSISVSIELQFCFISYSSCYIIRTR